MRILFCKIGYMKYYKGATKKDQIFNGGKYIDIYKNGGETHNFDARKLDDGKEYCIGFVETKCRKGYNSAHGKSNQLHIEKIDSVAADKITPYLDDVLVVWCATRVQNDMRIVGWYKHATVYREYQNLDDNNFGYNIKAIKENCVLVPYTIQNPNKWIAPSAKKRGYGFGQSLVWYASEAKAQKYVQDVISNIDLFSEMNFIDINENNDPYLKNTILI